MAIGSRASINDPFNHFCAGSTTTLPNFGNANRFEVITLFVNDAAKIKASKCTLKRGFLMKQ